MLDFIHLSATGVAKIAESPNLKGCPHTFEYMVYNTHDFGVAYVPTVFLKPNPEHYPPPLCLCIPHSPLSPPEQERDGDRFHTKQQDAIQTRIIPQGICFSLSFFLSSLLFLPLSHFGGVALVSRVIEPAPGLCHKQVLITHSSTAQTTHP